jgi:hypothetical protein
VNAAEQVLLGGLNSMLEDLAKVRPDLMRRDCVQAACIGFESAFAGLAGMVASGEIDRETPGLWGKWSPEVMRRIKLLVMLHERTADGVDGVDGADSADGYTPYGPEWEREVMRLPKTAVVGMYRMAAGAQGV